jgi:phosphoglycolate phosphatase (TIGR01487 family)
LTDENHLLDIEALIWMRKAEQAGLPIILSSARTKLELRIASGLFGTTGPVVGENGGIVWHRSTREERVLGDLEKVQEAYKVISSCILDLERILEGYRETDIMIRGRRASEIAPIIKFERLDVHLLESAHVTCITDNSTNKGIGLKAASRMIGINPNQVVAVGDAHNDVALFKAAGAGFAVANADERLRNVSTKVMDRPYGGGCADAIKEVLRENNEEQETT